MKPATPAEVDLLRNILKLHATGMHLEEIEGFLDGLTMQIESIPPIPGLLAHDRLQDLAAGALAAYQILQEPGRRHH